ncbi:MAG TPA: TetR family transcriptional regulator, partial [Nannocystis exedens]|nr:TetR family transcriptional regulator [Nannocystis exedens]
AMPQVAADAGVAAGTIYRFFASKEVLVNEVFRHCKGTLAQALNAGVDLNKDPAEGFAATWAVLYRFAREHRFAFRFLEMQDHAPYLDDESRALEAAVLMPIGAAIMRLRADAVFRDEPTLTVTMALLWGAFVGIMKAEQSGYLEVTEADITQARDACWRAFATDDWHHHPLPPLPRSAPEKRP